MTRLVCIVIVALVGCQTDVIVGSNFRADLLDAVSLPRCADDMDNDDDMLTDWPFDPGCQAPGDDSEEDPPLPPACSDGIDNDNDAITDFPLEPGCESAADDDETDPAVPAECSDGIDNDGDGATDYPDDDSCYGAGDSTESTVAS